MSDNNTQEEVPAATSPVLVSRALKHDGAIKGSFSLALCQVAQDPPMSIGTSVTAAAAAAEAERAAWSRVSLVQPVDQASELRRHAREILHRSKTQALDLLESAKRLSDATIAESQDRATKMIEQAQAVACGVVDAAQGHANGMLDDGVQKLSHDDVFAEGAGVEAASELTAQQSRGEQYIFSGQETEYERDAGAQGRGDAMMSAAQLQGDQVRDEAEAATEPIFGDANLDTSRLGDNGPQDSSFSSLWESTAQAQSDARADEFFAGMEQRDVGQIFKP